MICAELSFGSLQDEGITTQSSALDAHRGNTCSNKFHSPARNLVPINRLIQMELNYIPRLLLVVGSSNSLISIIGTVFELVVEFCVSNGNEYQH